MISRNVLSSLLFLLVFTLVTPAQTGVHDRFNRANGTTSEPTGRRSTRTPRS